MSVTLGSGFAPYFLNHIKTITGDSTPQYKLDPQGFINLLQSQTKPEILRLDSPGGHKKTVQIRYAQRWTKDFTDTTKSCDQINIPVRAETSVELSSTRQIAFHIPDETIAKYEEDASKVMNLGAPVTGVMNELMEQVIMGSNAILSGVNDDLATLAVAAIGKNRVTGVTTSTSLNFALNTTNLPLNDGATRVLSDYKINGGTGTPQVWGSGLMYQYMLQQASKANDQSGLDTSVIAGGMKFYHDLGAISTLGSNQFVVYQPNAIQMVEYLEYTGFKAGQKPGASTFGVIYLPMQVGSEVLPVAFDYQLKYNDCDTTFTDAYYGTSQTVGKGYALIISKQCGLFTIPSGAYRATDGLTGNRGSLRYTATNV